MRVLHISAGIYNGAGKAAAKIHSGLLARGVKSRLCVAIAAKSMPAGSFAPTRGVGRKLVERVTRPLNAWMLEELGRKHEDGVSSGLIGFDIAAIVAAERPDLVHLHWLGDTSFEIGSLAGIGVPMVWRLPDMWAFCPVEYYQPDAARYAGPAAGARAGFGRSAVAETLAWRAKANAYRRIDRLTVACPSRWLAREAQRSTLLGRFPIEVVRTGCDTSVFRPLDQAECRRALGLPVDRPILLTGALSLTLKRKGTTDLIAALSMLGEAVRGCMLATFGADSALRAQLGGAIEVRDFGRLDDRDKLARLYAASDAFIAPSRMENLANTVLEAASCGTPVIGFDIGGMPDVIDHQQNGYLAEPFSAESLAEGLRWALGPGRLPAARARARLKIVEHFSVKQELDAYIALYQRMTGVHEIEAGAGRPSAQRVALPSGVHS